MKRLVLVLLVAALQACGTAPQIQGSRPEIDWTGRTADALVATMGAPSNVYQLDSGGRVYEYITRTKTTIRARDPIAMRQVQRQDPAAFDLPHVLEPEPPRNTAAWTTWNKQRNARVYIHKRTVTPTCRVVYNVSADNIIESWYTEGERCAE